MTNKFNNVYVGNSYTIASVYEKGGPIADYFDLVYDKDLYYGCDTFEKAEEKMLFDYSVNAGGKYTSIFEKPASIIVNTQSSTTAFIGCFDGSSWTGDYVEITLGVEADLSNTNCTHISVAIPPDSTDEYIDVNGVRYYYGVQVAGDVVKEPYGSGEIVTRFDTTYGLKTLIDWVDNSTDEQFVAEYDETDYIMNDFEYRYSFSCRLRGGTCPL